MLFRRMAFLGVFESKPVMIPVSLICHVGDGRVFSSDPCGFL